MQLPQTVEIETKRLILRQWQPSDYTVFAALNADAETMRYFPAPLSADASHRLARRLHDLLEQQGWGVWAVETKTTRQFIGCIGLHKPADDLPFSPCVEVVWRLLKSEWGQGFATEGAQAALNFAYQQLRLSEVVAFTTTQNIRSERVMQRLGMHRDKLTFQHPGLPADHPLREHCLYRLAAPLSA